MQRHPHFPLCRLCRPLCGHCGYLSQSPTVQSMRWDIGHRWWWCWLRLSTDSNECQYVPRPVWYLSIESCLYSANHQHPYCHGWQDDSSRQHSINGRRICVLRYIFDDHRANFDFTNHIAEFRSGFGEWYGTGIDHRPVASHQLCCLLHLAEQFGHVSIARNSPQNQDYTDHGLLQNDYCGHQPEFHVRKF